MNKADGWPVEVVPEKKEKKGVFIKIDQDTLEWLKAHGKGYQNYINDILRTFVQYQREQKIVKAQDLYNRFFSKCFWHCDPHLKITEEHLPFVIDGLRKNGGKEEFILAGELCR